MLNIVNKIKNFDWLNFLKELRFKALRGAIYTIILVLAILLGFSLFFPVDRVKTFTEHHIQASTGMKVFIDQVSFYGLTGIRFQGVRLFSNQPQAPKTESSPSSENQAGKNSPGEEPGSTTEEGAATAGAGGTGDEGEQTGEETKGDSSSDDTTVATQQRRPSPPRFMVIDELSARVRILPLLIGRLNVGFRMDGLGGTAHGVAKRLNSPESQSFSLKIEGLNLATIILIRDKIGFPLEGSLDGQVDMTLNQEDSTLSRGTITVELTDGKLGQGSIPLPPGMMFTKFDLTTPTSLGNLKLALRLGEADDTEDREGQSQGQSPGKGGVVASRPRIPVPPGASVLHIEQIEQDSEDLSLQGSGYITLLPDTRFSRPDLNLKFKLKDGFVARNHLSPIIQARQFKNVERDGFYGLSVQGTITNLNARLTRPQPTPPSSGSPAGAR